MTVKLTRLQSSLRLFDAEGRPTAAFQTWWQRFAESIEKAIVDIQLVNEAQQEAIEAILAAQAAADAANAAAEAAQAAADTAAQAATNAQTVADSATTALEQIETGEFDIIALKVGGQRFVNDGGVLALE